MGTFRGGQKEIKTKGFSFLFIFSEPCPSQFRDRAQLPFCEFVWRKVREAEIGLATSLKEHFFEKIQQISRSFEKESRNGREKWQKKTKKNAVVFGFGGKALAEKG